MPHERIPTVDVITVLWNHQRFVVPLMEGLRIVAYPHEALTMHIVDNASSDGSADVVRAFMAAHPDLPRVILHESGSNLGFSGGNNLIMKDSTADYVFLLNPDAIFEEGTLREAVALS